MKRKFLLALMVSCLCFPFTANATNYLNDDPYFPQTGGRMATREYTDLTSIYIREETEKYIDLEVGCVFTWGSHIESGASDIGRKTANDRSCLTK